MFGVKKQFTPPKSAQPLTKSSTKLASIATTATRNWRLELTATMRIKFTVKLVTVAVMAPKASVMASAQALFLRTEFKCQIPGK